MTKDEGEKLQVFFRGAHAFKKSTIELFQIAEKADDWGVAVYRNDTASPSNNPSNITMGRALISDLAETCIGRSLREEEILLAYRDVETKKGRGSTK